MFGNDLFISICGRFIPKWSTSSGPQCRNNHNRNMNIMKKLIIPLTLVLGTIVSEVNAQVVVVRRPVRRVVVAPLPPARMTVVRPLPRVIVTPRPVVVAPDPVIITPKPVIVAPFPVQPLSSTTVVRRKTVIYKP